MKPLNKAATATLQGLLSLGQTKVQRSSSFMAVHIEEIASISAGRIYSLAHYYTQNGDLMADPEMEILHSAVDGQFYPISFRMDSLGIHRNSVIFDDGKLSKLNLKMQYDQAAFANKWLRNIAVQQQF
jgi:hypothetical protein